MWWWESGLVTQVDFRDRQATHDEAPGAGVFSYIAIRGCAFGYFGVGDVISIQRISPKGVEELMNSSEGVGELMNSSEGVGE